MLLVPNMSHCKVIKKIICTWVNVVRCLLLAGVGQEAVVGVCPACCGPRAGDSAEDAPEDPVPVPPGSGFNFLNAPSAVGNIL